MMDKLLPIVPGCKALLLGSCIHSHLRPLLRTEVTVGERSIAWKDSFVIDSDLVRSLKRTQRVSWKEKDLLRIDGGDFSHEKDSHELGLKA